MRLQQLDKFRGDFDGDGKDGVEADQEAAFAGAAGLEQIAFIAVHRSADNVDAPPVHIRGDFRGEKILWIGSEADSPNEARHLRVADGDGDAIALAAGETVLQCGSALHHRVKALAGRADKEKVVDNRHRYAFAPRSVADNTCHKRSIDIKSHFIQPFICGKLGIWARQITHRKPLRSVIAVTAIPTVGSGLWNDGRTSDNAIGRCRIFEWGNVCCRNRVVHLNI